MKRLLAACALSLLPSVSAWANIIPTNISVTGTGTYTYTWTYDLQLSADQNAPSGSAPGSNPVSRSDLLTGAFLTLYDFAGYVDGSCAGPAGWTCTSQMVGYTPDDVLPTDNPGVRNITWTYTSGPTLLGQPHGLDLGLFTALSDYYRPTMVSYAARGMMNRGPAEGTWADNVGLATAPTSVPEPSSMALVGLGLFALRRFGKKRVTQP
jgi:hypothetical protein